MFLWKVYERVNFSVKKKNGVPKGKGSTESHSGQIFFEISIQLSHMPISVRFLKMTSESSKRLSLFC